jgi:hypothetical protein
MPKVNFVKKARKDINSEIKAGDSYYWWKFRYGGKRVSKTPPKPKDLTQSDFLISLYSIEEEIESFSADDKESFDSQKEDILSQIEDLKTETEDKLSNMPEQLQSAPTGELLQERIDGLEEWYSELEAIECEYDEDELREELAENNLSKEEIEEELLVKIQEKTIESVDEFQSTSHNF